MGQPILKPISNFLALVLHPLFIATYTSLVLLFFTHGIFSFMNFQQRFTFLWLIFIATFVLPLLVVMLVIIMQKNQLTFRDLYLEKGKDRFWAFMVVAAVYAFISYFLYHTWYNHYVLATIIAFIALAIFITGIISLIWKISAHSVGIGGFLAYLLIFNISFMQAELFKLLVPTIFIGGLLMSSRVYLHAHNLKQVYTGFILGFVICASSILFV